MGIGPHSSLNTGSCHCFQTVNSFFVIVLKISGFISSKLELKQCKEKTNTYFLKYKLNCLMNILILLDILRYGGIGYTKGMELHAALVLLSVGLL